MMEYLVIAAIIFIGLAAVILHRHSIRKVIGLTVMNNGVVLLFIYSASSSGVNSPILGEGISSIVDPVPQALMLTAIVIGVCVNALALALAVRMYQKTGSFDLEETGKEIHDELDG